MCLNVNLSFIHGCLNEIVVAVNIDEQTISMDFVFKRAHLIEWYF